jgi:ABC-type uncharacterized transport system substrate-binding protein
VSRNIKTGLVWIFLVLTVVAMTWFKLSQPRIIVLHSYAPDYSWTRDIDIGLRRTLDAKLGYRVQWHYMDTKNHPDQAFKRKAGALARRAIDSLNPDLIIAIDDDAQAYAAKHYAGKPDIAIIFAGVNGSVESYGYDTVSNVTGIYERKPLLDLRRALSAMRGANGLELGRRILHLGDHSSAVDADVKEIDTFDWAPFRLIGSHQVKTFDKWKKVIKSANGVTDVIVISNYHNLFEAADEMTLAVPTEVMKWTESNARVPVVGLGGWFVEDGGMFAVGLSGFEQGETAARMAIRVLDGGAIPIDVARVMPRQFLVYMRNSMMDERKISLPSLYEAFAKALNNYYE